MTNKDSEKLELRKQAVAAFYDSIEDPTRRLTIAAFECDSTYVPKAIADGADVNAVHGPSGMPVIHLVAGAGLTDAVNALLETNACDLTVRDNQGRLPSDCAAYCARDQELAALLAGEEAKQFRQTGKDPRMSPPV